MQHNCPVAHYNGPTRNAWVCIPLAERLMHTNLAASEGSYEEFVCRLAMLASQTRLGDHHNHGHLAHSNCTNWSKRPN